MTALIIDVPSDVYEQPVTAAHQQQKTIEVLARDWLAARSALTHHSERERAWAALRAVGLLAEPPVAEAHQNKASTPEE